MSSPRRRPPALPAAAPPRPDPILLRGNTTIDHTHLDVGSPRNEAQELTILTLIGSMSLDRDLSPQSYNQTSRLHALPKDNCPWSIGRHVCGDTETSATTLAYPYLCGGSKAGSKSSSKTDNPALDQRVIAPQ
jgi:hypothetical protein